MLDLSRQYASIRSEVLAAITRVCDSQRYILGDEVVAFEREFAPHCGTSHAAGCASGTDGLWLALAAAGIGHGDSVITTPFSFFATASSILRAGAKPIFADIDPETLNLDPASVEQKLKLSSTKAIMPVHLYGQCADMDSLGRLAVEFKLHIIEDAAQAVGATWNGRLAGSLGPRRPLVSIPPKISALLVMPGRLPPTTETWQNGYSHCAITAASNATTTMRSAPTAVWIQSRPRFCALRCLSWKNGTGRATNAPAPTAACSPAPG